MTSNGRLYIAIIAVTKRRAMIVLEEINKMEEKNGNTDLYRIMETLYTDNAVYVILEQDKCNGFTADQIIVDYKTINPNIMDQLLYKSCVPYEYQVIDDTCLLGDE